MCRNDQLSWTMSSVGCLLKPSQNKKGRKHHFLKFFLQLVAEKKDSKTGAARKYFGPSYFVTAL